MISIDAIARTHKYNKLVILAVWIVVFAHIVLNLILQEYSIIIQTVLYIISPLLIVTILNFQKVLPLTTKYLTPIFILTGLTIINIYSINYINLMFFVFLPLFTFIYRDWIFTMLNCAGSAIIFYYLLIRYGDQYFINWQLSDILYWLLILGAVYVMLLLESRSAEHTRNLLEVELNEVKQLQRELSYNELRYRSMIKQTREGIFAFDPTSKLIVEASQRFCEILGYTEAEILTKKVSDIVAHDLQSVERNIEFSMRNENQYVGERKYVRKDGTLLDVEVRTSSIMTEREHVILVNIRDITEKLKNEYELRLAKNILDNTLDGAVALDLSQKIIYANPAFEKVTGYKIAEVLGQKISVLKSQQHNVEFYENMWRDINEKGIWEGELINKKKDGSIYVQRTQIHAILDSHKQPIFYTSVFRDITVQKEAELKLKEVNEALSKLSNLDGLLGISNRRCYNEVLEQTWQKSVEDQTSLSIIMLDIDHFKIYNDTYGHLQGDECLKKVAQTLKDHLAAIDERYFLARYGGEEFSVILPNADAEQTLQCAERLRQAVEDLQLENMHSKVKPIVTISLGVATTQPTEYSNAKDLLQRADQALYKAKEAGRNRVSI